MPASTLARTLLATALVAVAGGGLSACKKPQAKKAAEAPRAVRVATVTDLPISGGLTATGVFMSREEAAVGAELAGYRVASVLTDVDGWVSKGQPIVILDDTLIRSQIAQAQANVAQQRVAAEQADAQAKRVAGLDNEGVISQEAIQQRRYQAQSAHAAVAAATASLNDLKTRQARLVIRAPVSGRVMERNIRPGDISSPGTVMFRIIRDGLVELDAQVPEASLGQIGENAKAEALLPNGQQVFGAVRFVSPAVDPQTKLGHVRIALPVRRDLRPGGYARAIFNGLMRTVPAVPDTAVRYSSSGPTVMTLDNTSHAHEVDVRTGQHENGWVELVKGPPAGTRVLLGGSAFVLEGDKVQALTETEQPPAAAKAPPAPAGKA